MPQEYEFITHTVMAVQLTPQNVEHVLDFCGGIQVEEIDPFDSTKKFIAIMVPTSDGVRRASLKPDGGDWILKRGGTFKVMPHCEFIKDYRKIA